ncbi:MAG: hypothetical protein ACKVVP_16460 [Chloroflexota bacterium]
MFLATPGGNRPIETALSALPPSLILTLLIAWFHGSLFFLLGGSRGRHLLFYITLASVAGITGQFLASTFNIPAILAIGDCHSLAVAGACWLGFLVTRRQESVSMRTKA